MAANLAQLYVDHDADVALLLSGVGRLGGELRSAGTLTIENTAEAGALTLEGRAGSRKYHRARPPAH